MTTVSDRKQPEGRSTGSQYRLAVVLLAMMVLSGAIGYVVGQSHSDADPIQAAAVEALESLDIQPIDETALAGEVQRHNSVAAEALSATLADLRASIVELRMVFSHLADVAKLDDNVFQLEDHPIWSDGLPGQSSSSDDGSSSSLWGFDIYANPILDVSLGLFKRELDHMSTAAVSMQEVFSEQELNRQTTVAGRPIAKIRASSGFGYRKHPLTGRRGFHRGLDLRGKRGEPIVAMAAGVVSHVGYDNGYGNFVELQHPDGYRTRYAHNRSNEVVVGQVVRKGQLIARLGSSGRSTGPHLHLEVRHDGKAVDPRGFVR